MQNTLNKTFFKVTVCSLLIFLSFSFSHSRYTSTPVYGKPYPDLIVKLNHFNLEVFQFVLQIRSRKSHVVKFQTVPIEVCLGFVTPRPDEVHSICNCRGAYVHQVSL